MIVAFPLALRVGCPADVGWLVPAWLRVGTPATSLAVAYLLSLPALLVGARSRWRWASTVVLYASGALVFSIVWEPKPLGPLLWPGWVWWDATVPLVWCGN